MAEQHPDDEFHPPTTDDPFWTETCWFTFTVPERRLSGQLYPFFRPNQGVVSAAAYFWDDTVHDHRPTPCTPATSGTCRMPDQPLTRHPPAQRHPPTAASSRSARYRALLPTTPTPKDPTTATVARPT